MEQFGIIIITGIFAYLFVKGLLMDHEDTWTPKVEQPEYDNHVVVKARLPDFGKVTYGYPDDLLRGQLVLSEYMLKDWSLKFQGRVDQAYRSPVGKLFPVDTKLGRPRRIKAREVVQLSLYRHLIAAHFKVPFSETADYGYIRFSTGSKDGFVRVQLVEVSHEILNTVAGEVRAKKLAHG